MLLLKFINKNKMTNKIGFIILRHVNSRKTNYWIECYRCIRRFYPMNKIMIIDDNSKYEYVENIEAYNTKILYNVTVVKNQYPQRGELMPYIYYLHNKIFDTAVILHDSVFINKHIDIDANVDQYRMIWDFRHNWDLIDDETRMLEVFNDKRLLAFHENTDKWRGCFGGMCIIKHDYLVAVNAKYDLHKLIDMVLCRYNRCSFERVIACLLQIGDDEDNEDDEYNEYMGTTYGYGKYKKRKSALFGDIHDYCKLNVQYKDKHTLSHLPWIKIWTGR